MSFTPISIYMSPRLIKFLDYVNIPFMRERMEEQPKHQSYSGLHTIERAEVLGQVLDNFGLPYEVLAEGGDSFPDQATNPNQRVPMGTVYVRYETGTLEPQEIWAIVDEICPRP